MHPSNYTLYQLTKFHIELTESMEYTLITYKYNKDELISRFEFLNSDFKKGFYHKIVTKLFKKSKKLTSEIKDFLKHNNPETIEAMVNDKNLNSRIVYNNNLYLAYAASNNILQVFLNEEALQKDIDETLKKLVKITNTHFNLFCLFNSLNLFVSSKVNLLQGDSLYTLESEDNRLILSLLKSIENEIEQKDLINKTLDLLTEKTKFNEEKAYELLNEISIKCIETEKDLYSDFEKFTQTLEKELEKQHN